MLRAAAVSVVLLTCLVGGVYPGVVTLLGYIAFPWQAEGSLIRQQNSTRVRGSYLIGQKFSTLRYLHGRPSNAGGNGYDAAASSGSNFGPSSARFVACVRDRCASYRHIHRLPDALLLPADAVLASASGLDPEITLQNALCQAARIACERGIAERQVRHMMRGKAQRALGVIGQKRLHVVEFNMLLDTYFPGGGHESN